MNMIHILAQAAPDASILNGWWDIAQKVGSGGFLVSGVVVFFLAKAYDAKDKALTAEVAYSKDRDKQTLTVMTEYTTLIKTMDARDVLSVSEAKSGTTSILKAIDDLKGTIMHHVLKA